MLTNITKGKESRLRMPMEHAYACGCILIRSISWPPGLKPRPSGIQFGRPAELSYCIDGYAKKKGSTSDITNICIIPLATSKSLKKRLEPRKAAVTERRMERSQHGT